MPANTAHGYPYPLGTDRVMDGDDAIHNLASAVDAQLGVMASGTVVVPTPNVTTVYTYAVTFPAGRFNAPPNVSAGLQAANPQNFAPIGITGITATGCTLTVYRLAGGTTNTTVSWVAHLI